MIKQSPVDYLIAEIQKIGFSVDNTLEFEYAYKIAKEMEAENCQRQFIQESNPGLFPIPCTIESTPKISREQVWTNAWCAVANANNCVTSEAPRNWADKCLVEFDKRFGNKGGEQ